MSATSTQIQLNPDVLIWTRERASLTIDELSDKLNVPVDAVSEWEATGIIDIRVISKLAGKTKTPVGYLYLSDPPIDALPIRDFRTHSGQTPSQPSPNLLDTLYSIMRRQNWLRDELIGLGHEPLPFVGIATEQRDPKVVAKDMQEKLGIGNGWASFVKNRDRAFAHLRQAIINAGIFVVSNGVVENNTWRRLDPDEFRGFALVDDYAPFVFVNSNDYETARIFTLIHETAHVWLGISAVSNFYKMNPTDHVVEIWCNAVAGEFLVPENEFLANWNEKWGVEQLNILADQFKVSKMVVARRALDLKRIDQAAYDTISKHSLLLSERKTKENEGSGGEFWNTQGVRVGHKFGELVMAAVKEGRLLHQDAYKLTGLKKSTSFNEFARKLGYEIE